MKVIGINGISRKDGNTAIIICKVFDELNKEGIGTELIQLADYEIQPCKGCFACKGRGNCVFSDDGFTEVFIQMVETDGIILGSPVYSADISAKMKAFLERAVSNQNIIIRAVTIEIIQPTPRNIGRRKSHNTNPIIERFINKIRCKLPVSVVCTSFLYLRALYGS